MPTTSGQGIPSRSEQVPELTLLAASPITEIKRTRASARGSSSASRSSRSRPAARRAAFLAASSMCCRRILSSSGSTQLHRLLQDFLPEIPAQVARCTEVNFESGQLAQLPFHAGHVQQSDARPGLELHQQVQVAVLAKVIDPVSQNGAEGLEVADGILTAVAVDLPEPPPQILFVVSTDDRDLEIRRFPPEDSPFDLHVKEESLVAQDRDASESIHRRLPGIPLLDLLPQDRCSPLQGEQQADPRQVVDENVVQIEAAAPEPLSFLEESREEDLRP